MLDRRCSTPKRHPGNALSGTPANARVVPATFGAVLTFGLTALGYGLWQMVTVGRSKRVIYFAVALAAGLMLVAFSSSAAVV